MIVAKLVSRSYGQVVYRYAFPEIGHFDVSDYRFEVVRHANFILLTIGAFANYILDKVISHLVSWAALIRC